MSQNDKLQKMLLDGRKVTRVIAMHYGIMNLTARIADLRIRRALDIRCGWQTDADGNRYGEFYIANQQAA